ncbi:penicillin-binding protein 2 [Sphingomonas sp.]|uniref:penicillin-binding protein 2 n=1 Tax=Sphingomonas sp. TaxID=28214 RepID=UPI0025FEEB6E|nr:penicillin-binding protein 2 [Sphingomonas sp.]
MRFDWILGKRSVSEAQAQFSFTRRSFVLGGAQVGVGVLLAARMTYLSVFENERYALLAESNRVNLSLIPPRRGWIVDRAGKPLALNRTVFRVDIIPDRLVDQDKTLDTLTNLLGLTSDDRDRIERDIDRASGFQPVQVAEHLDWEKYAALSIRAPDLPGVVPAQGFARYYPEGAAVGHLLGYVGAASAEAYKKTKDPLYLTPGYKIGKDGIEKMLEPSLRGAPGARRSEVTARGKLVRDLATRPDIPGDTLHLTIDAGLQAYAARRLGENSGAVTVIDTLTGGILAMASMPAYDPNSFSDGIGRAEYAALTSDDHLPLVNKALQGLYPPGSTSKPSTSLALLEAGIDPNATVVCTGAYRVGNAVFHCSKRRGHGAISLERAIIQSCDIYYYHFGKMAGIAPLAKMFRKLGLGAEYPLPVPSQRYGTVPDPEWLMRRYKKPWSTFDTVNTSIGQGYVLVSPMQLAVMAARIASGNAVSPHLTGRGGPGASLGITPEHLAFVQKAMGNVVNSGFGTASVAKLPVEGIQMGGKTGTAQVRRITMAERASGVLSNAALPWKFRDHALFVGFAPVVNPRYAVSVIIEHGGWGASAAAPVARDTMTYLFDPEKAMATLVEQEKGWGGDIATRMAKKAAGYALPKVAAPTATDNEQDTAQ